MRRSLTFISTLPLLAVSACAMSGEPPVPPLEQGKQLVRAVPREPAAPAVIDGNVPAELLSQIRADLAKNSGAAADNARVVSAQSVVWPDGSLGCAQPGQMYTQATVPGYRIVLESGGKTFAYHASAQGFFKLCRSALHNARPSTD